MRRAAIFFLLSACDPAAIDDAGADAAEHARDAGIDAPSDAAMIDGGEIFVPSPANVGWIGGACADAADCFDVEAPICLRDGFPNGACAQPCTGICPDRGEPGDTLTFCVDGLPYGLDSGVCLSRCDPEVLPPDGCADGYRCVAHNRYGDPRTVVSVCVPERPERCPGARDELVPLDYPDRGAVWIPAEAACERAELVVMLHGINPDSHETPSLGGGRHLELLVRQLIDARLVLPLVLAEPVHFQGSSTLLYGDEFDPAEHLARVAEILDARAVELGSLSYVGHSGAGCDRNNGLYEVLDRRTALIPAFAPALRLWGAMDTCYAGAYHWDVPRAVLGGENVVLANIATSGDSAAAMDAFDDGLMPDALALDCAASRFARCARDPVEHWCSYRTSAASAIVHDTNPYFFFREILPRALSPDPSIEACR